jgi:hypothetical protein
MKGIGGGIEDALVEQKDIPIVEQVIHRSSRIIKVEGIGIYKFY